MTKLTHKECGTEVKTVSAFGFSKNPSVYCGVCHIYIPLASESIEKLHLNGEGADDCLCNGCLLKTHINLVKLV